MMKRWRSLIYVVAALLFLPACGIIPLYSHSNTRLPSARLVGQFSADEVPSGSDVASLEVPWDMNWQCRNSFKVPKSEPAGIQMKSARRLPREGCAADDLDFVAVAISGGGSRAAVFSAAVLFELERYGLLQQVDVMSSVSGGSFTAAFYALSCDREDNCPATVEGPSRFTWEPKTVFPLLELNYIWKWFGNWFWPHNIARFWLTHYDRTDIMAETLSDNLFDNSLTGNEGFRFHDLNPQRPNLLINATDFTSQPEAAADENQPKANLYDFTFTKEEFQALRSDLDQFPVAYAVMASATFPGVFNYVTLKNFAKAEDEYGHLFDGGTYDNLGLTSLWTVLENMARKDPKGRDAPKIVVLIDAFTPVQGRDRSDPDPRKMVDYVIDTNFLDAYDTLMAGLRMEKINRTRNWLENNNGTLAHLEFAKLKAIAPAIHAAVKGIKTSLEIEEQDAICLKHAARILVKAEMERLREDARFKDMIADPPGEAYPIEPCAAAAR